jgi:colanic acid biosynthesis glycosyl transferase WcaI
VNLVVLCPHFAPDVAPTGEVMTRIAMELIERGHRLHVVTSLPWYQRHALEPGWDGQLVRGEVTEWGRISRVHPFPTDKRNIPARALAFGGFTALAAAVGGVSTLRPDAVLAMSPPLTLGPAGWAVATARREPLVFNIQDVFPDVAVELGLLQGRRAIAAARWLERWSYRLSDAVTVLSDDLADNVRTKISSGLDAERADREAAKVRVIPNFVDTDRIRPDDRENSYRADHGLSGQKVVMYAGNVGFSQSLDLVLLAARSFAVSRPEVVFVINGGGAARPDLEVAAADLPNVRFVDMQPSERLPEVLAAARME